MNTFLSELKSQIKHSYNNQPKKVIPNIRFMIESKNNNVYLSVVNDKLTPVDVDYHYYTDENGLLLRSMARIIEEEAMDFSWTDETGKIELASHPHLIYQLIRCNNIVDVDGRPIVVSNESNALLLTLRNGEKQQLYPSIRLLNSLSTEDDKNQITLLTDCFVLCGHTICPIKPIGENYKLLYYFLEPFAEEMTEAYLSTLYSYIDNIELDWDNGKIVFERQAVTPTLTLTFEKIDPEKVLYMRLSESAGNIPSELIRQFDLSLIAQTADDGTISIRPLDHIDLGQAQEELRKLILSYAPNKEAKKDVYMDDDLFLVPEQTAGPFLLGALPSLISNYKLEGAEKLREYKVKPVIPKLNINLSSGIDFLEGDASLAIDDQTFTLQQLFKQYNSKRYIQLSDGNRAILDDLYMKRLERIFTHKKNKNGKITISFFDLPEIEDLVNEPLNGEAFKHYRNVYEGFNELAKQRLKTPQLNATLRPYQKEGIKWMKYLYDNDLGGCLADDMGLGKTVQTIGMLTLLYPKVKTPTLIVMPRSLIFNWQNELKRFAPQLSTYVYYGQNRNMEEAMQQQVIITSYAVVRNDIESFLNQQFNYVILDESQNIKNVTAQTTQATLLLKAQHRLALSGTPIENNLTELYSLFRFLNPTMFGSIDDFNQRYTNPIQKDRDKDATLALRKKIKPFLLRRLKKDVLQDLPDRTDQAIYAEMSSEQKSFYEQRRIYYYNNVRQTIAKEGVQKSQFVMFQALNELRRIASVPESLTDGQIKSPKLELLEETLLDTIANGHKAVVFFNFIAGLDLLSERLEKEGIDFACMTGSTRDRKSIVERFQNDSKCMVLLMTLKTGGVGLNLTAADTVFIFEPWWNKAAEEQAINRLHRLGQKAKVLAYSMITQDTIEEKILLLQQQKAELFDGLIGNDASSSKQLSEEDINFILG